MPSLAASSRRFHDTGGDAPSSAESTEAPVPATFAAYDNVSPEAPASPTSSAAKHTLTLLPSAALACLIRYLPGNQGTSHVSNSGSDASSTFLSTEEVFAAAMQSPSARSVANTGAAFSPSRTSSVAGATVTQPLAFLAAGPRCRRALEEHLRGGCVLPPAGALRLQVRRREPPCTTFHCFSVPSKGRRSPRSPGGHPKKSGQLHRAFSDDTAPTAATAIPKEHLLVLSTNVPPVVPPFQPPPPMNAPTLSPVQRPHSALVVPLSPRRTSTPSPQPSAAVPSAPTPFSTASPAHAMSATAAVIPGTEESPPQSSSPPLGDTVAGDLLGGAGAPAPPLSSRSPVLQSRRLSIGKGGAAAGPSIHTPHLSALSSTALPPPRGGATMLVGAGLPPIRSTSETAIATAAAAPAQTSASKVVVHSTRVVSASAEEGALGGGRLRPAAGDASTTATAATPALRPTYAFPMGPHPRPSRVSSSPFITAAPASRSPPRSPLPPPSSSIPPATPAVSVALQTLCHALWWMRRGPLPISLSLLRHDEADLEVLWGIMKVDGDGEESTAGARMHAIEHAAATANAKEGTLLETPLAKSFSPRSPSALPSPARPPETAALSANAAASVQAASPPTRTAVELTRPSPLPWPLPMTEVHVHGGAATTAVATLLPGHPEVRSLRLTHATLSDAQLRSLTLHCPDVTHLSLAMNQHVRTAAFLGSATPSEVSSSTTTATVGTSRTATTAVYRAVPSHENSAAFRNPALPLLGRLEGHRKEDSEPEADEAASVRVHLDDSDADARSAHIEGRGLASLLSHPHARQQKPPPSATAAAASRSVQSPRTKASVSLSANQSSQLDLFAAEEEGEAEMRLSLWQAAQSDAAERRQAVFILRPTDVVLGAAAAVAATGGGSADGEGNVQKDQTAQKEADVSAASAAVVVNVSLPSSPSTVTSIATTQHTDPLRPATETAFRAALAGDTAPAEAMPRARSEAAKTHETQSVVVPSTPMKDRQGHGDASPHTPVTAKAARASSRRSSTHGQPRRRRCSTSISPHQSSPRKRHAQARWSDTLLDLDLSYTRVQDCDAARDLPRLRMLCCLSLEGCTCVSQVCWMPMLRHLRELNLSFSSVPGSALYSLGQCTHLAWLKLEGCVSFVRVDQLWRDAADDRSHAHASLEGISTRTTTETSLAPPPPPPPPPAAAATVATSTRLVRHRAMGGIAAITVLPPSASATATGRVDGAAEGREERDAEAIETEHANTVTSPSSSVSSPSPTAHAPPTAAEVPLLGSLRTLVATGTGLTDAGLQPAPLLEGLECLALDRCAQVTNVAVLADLPSLHTLDVSRTGVDVEGLAELRRSRSLRHLRLQECLNLTQLPVLFVEPNPPSHGACHTLTVDEALSSKRSRASSAIVSAAGPPLEVLDVSLSTHLLADGLHNLVTNALTLNLSDAAHSAAAAGAVVGNREPAFQLAGPTSALDGARSGSPQRVSSPEILPHVFPQVRHLLLRSCSAVRDLGKLRGFTQVVELDLYHTDVDAATLTAALARWTCLEVLNIASTQVRSLAAWCPDPESGAQMEEALPVDAARQDTARQHHTLALPRAPPKPPAFAATLRVLALANTDVDSDGLMALQYFPSLETLQLSSCRRLASLRFLLVRQHAPLDTDAEATPLNEPPFAAPHRTALRELAVTEATDLTGKEAFLYLAGCTGLRSLSLAGCERLGSGARGAPENAFSSPVALAPAATLGTPASTNSLSRERQTRLARQTSSDLGEGKPQGVAVLRCMAGLTDLNLSNTAVTREDLQALLFEPTKRPFSVQMPEREATQNAKARSGTSTSSAPQHLAPYTTARRCLLPAITAPTSPSRIIGGSDTETAADERRVARTSIQRLWLRGCRCVDEEALLAVAAAKSMDSIASTASTAVAPEGGAYAAGLSAVSSIREVYLSRGRFGGAVLCGLLP